MAAGDAWPGPTLIGRCRLTAVMMSPSAVDLSFLSAFQRDPLFMVGSSALGLPALGAALVALIVLRTSWKIARALASAAVMLGLLAALIGLLGMRATHTRATRAAATPELSSSARGQITTTGQAEGSYHAFYGVALGAIPVVLGLGLLVAVHRRRRARG